MGISKCTTFDTGAPGQREPAAARSRAMESRVRLAGQRKDGSTFPARVNLSPVITDAAEAENADGT